MIRSSRDNESRQKSSFRADVPRHTVIPEHKTKQDRSRATSSRAPRQSPATDKYSNFWQTRQHKGGTQLITVSEQ